MNRKCYQTVPIAGLRSNPKLCEVRRYPGDGLVEVYCGLWCRHSACSEVEPGKLLETIELLKKQVILKHDEWMKTDKRNRIREGDSRVVPNEPVRIRRTPPGARWTARYRSTPSGIFAASETIRSAQNIRPNPTP